MELKNLPEGLTESDLRFKPCRVDPKEFNYDLIMNRRKDEDVLKHIEKVFINIEESGFIKYRGMRVITDYMEMGLYDVDKKNTKGTLCKLDHVMPMHDTAVMKVIVRLELYKGDQTTLKDIAFYVPVLIDNLYYLINGKKVYPLLQLVENSTYTTKGVVTFKNINYPVKVKKIKMNDGAWNYFGISIFNDKNKKKNNHGINFLYFYFAEMGIYETIKMFGFEDMIVYDQKLPNFEPIHHKFSFSKELYEKDEFFRDFVENMKYIFDETPHIKNSKIFKEKLWIQEFAVVFNSWKPKNKYLDGLTSLNSVRKMLDGLTKSQLKLYNHNKESIFHVIKWMMTHYDELKVRDSLDLNHKRLRYGEAIASHLADEINKKVNELVRSLNKSTLKEISNRFNMKEMRLVSIISSSPLFQHSELVNDNDIMNALAYTLKGPNSVGGTNSRKISINLKKLHPSQVGRLDLITGGKSSTGVTGMLTPQCKLYEDGHFAEDINEPQKYDYHIYNMIQDIKENIGKGEVIRIRYKDEDEFNLYQQALHDGDIDISLVTQKRIYINLPLSKKHLDDDDMISIDI